MLSISLCVKGNQLPSPDQACFMVVELQVLDEVTYVYAKSVTPNSVWQYMEWSKMHTLTYTTGTAPSTLRDVTQEFRTPAQSTRASLLRGSGEAECSQSVSA